MGGFLVGALLGGTGPGLSFLFSLRMLYFATLFVLTLTVDEKTVNVVSSSAEVDAEL